MWTAAAELCLITPQQMPEALIANALQLCGLKAYTGMSTTTLAATATKISKTASSSPKHGSAVWHSHNRSAVRQWLALYRQRLERKQPTG